MDDQSFDTLMEEKVELMFPPNGGKPTLREAFFLKPNQVCIEENLSFSSISSNFIIPESKKQRLNLFFPGWKRRQKGWKTWVDQLRPLYEDTWKRAGIFEAILASTYQTKRDRNLIINLAEKWCLETNTFFFSWGEATITLEDMMVLGGYSVSGDFALNPLKTEEMFRLKQKLSEIHLTISKTRGQFAREPAWMRYFKGRGEKLEHEAFLALWLSRYVFSTYYNAVRKDVFQIAISLSKGIPVALAPAVLASIYRDLGSLKKSLMALNKLENCGKGSDESKLVLSAPLHLVQLWAWERFPTLRPEPNLIQYGEPRIARWHKLKKLCGGDVRKALDSAGEDFQWRPYTIEVKNWSFKKFYKENQGYVLIDSFMDIDVQSWIKCLRISELVGMNCIELYLPHRVAMQFGFDQDVPGFIKMPNNLSSEIAWRNYNRAVRDARFYIPARLFESDVTKRYLEWWEKLKLEQENSTSNAAFPGFPSHFHELHRVGGDDDDDNEDVDEITLEELMKRRKRAGRNGETGVKFRLLAEISTPADKPTQSVTCSMRISEDENLGTAMTGEDKLMNIERNEEESYKFGVGKQLNSKTETADEGSDAGRESSSEIVEINELDKKDEVEKLEARVSYLERIFAGNLLRQNTPFLRNQRKGKNVS